MALTDNDRLIAFVLSKRFGYGEAIGSEKTPDCYLCDVATQICCAAPVETGLMTRMEKSAQEDSTSPEDNATLFKTAYRVQLKRAITAEVPFLEKMLAFWSNHLSVNDKNDGHYFANEAVFPYINQSFIQMLSAAIRHPVMIEYLNNDKNLGDNSQEAASRDDLGLNENLARELLELHTVGPEQYTHDDILETAKILSGFGADYDNGDPVTGGFFYPEKHEPGTKVVMGKTYVEGPEGLEAFLQDLATHESTAYRLVKKLLLYFNVPHDTSDITALSGIYLDNDTKLAPLYRAIMMLPRVTEYDMLTATTMRPYDSMIAIARHMFASLGSLPSPEDGHEEYGDVDFAINSLNHKPFLHSTPDGYPVDPLIWADTTNLATYFAAIDRMTRGYIPREAQDQFSDYVTKIPVPGAESTAAILDAASDINGRFKVTTFYMGAAFRTF